MSLFGKPKDDPDLFVRTTNGGSIIMQGEQALSLGDAIKAVIQGRAVIVPSDVTIVSPQHWLWRPETGK
jgi:hypothetical protein